MVGTHKSGPKSRVSLLEEDDNIPVISRGFLKVALNMSTVGALKFLAKHNAIRDGFTCPNCFVPMSLVKASDRSDGLKWRCPKCKNRERTVRDESFFSKSNLPIEKLVQILYVWSTNYCNNTFLEEEIMLSSRTAVSWLEKCREECHKYNLRSPKLGGPNKEVEMDQMCVTKQKHHRGAPNVTGNMWFQTFVEREEGGRCAAHLMEDRESGSIDAYTMNYLKEETTIISDEWPAHKNLKSRLEEQHGYKLGTHHMIKHKDTFAKNGTKFTIHTNKEEGLHAHMKRKMKNMMGTSEENVEAYIAKAVYRLNCNAKKISVFESFLDMISL